MAHGGAAHPHGSTAVKWVHLILRFVLGGIFLASAVIKIWDVQVSHFHVTQFSHVPDLATFAQDVTNYHVPPRELANLVAITLPWIELLAAIGWALAHGYNIRCGCFGTVDARKVGVTALMEDGVLLAMAIWLVCCPKDKPQQAPETNP